MDFAERAHRDKRLILAELPAEDPWRRMPADSDEECGLGVSADGRPVFNVGGSRIYAWDERQGAAIVIDFTGSPGIATAYAGGLALIAVADAE